MYIPEQYRGATDEETMAKMPDRMVISLKNLRRMGGRLMLTKNHVMLLEMLANTNWERPLYMSTTVGSENYVGLDPFFLQEGLAYRITPFNFRELGLASGGYAVDSETMYDNLMNRFKFGGMNNPGIYIDETITRMGYTHRRLYTMLANQLLREGKKDKALAVLDKCEEEFPASILPHNYWQSQSYLIGQAYLALGETEKGMNILSQVADNDIEYITWYLSLSDSQFKASFSEVQSSLSCLVKTLQIMERSSDKETFAHYSELFDKLYKELELRVK
jgi:tetratricopeptide (TPR) repeat protein